jgi:hypothetical protein
MPQPLFSESDLLLSQQALDDLFRARLNRGLAQPLSDVIEAATGTVRDYTARYDLPADRWRRLVRAIAHYLLLAFPGSNLSPVVKDEYAAALQELIDIRDGRFADLLPANPLAPLPAPRIAWGSTPRVPGT